eukprot:TRINITY_DN31065_c0_g1_i1.p1 TRINITY_DN31065_c0_g1~~TRINITY_DN31065_c0_g1_i1.p1  ORF type:complete len:690 (-),score=120.79 TRINITY_DN31065_c0_g1_i1:26-2095(-)
MKTARQSIWPRSVGGQGTQEVSLSVQQLHRSNACASSALDSFSSCSATAVIAAASMLVATGPGSRRDCHVYRRQRRVHAGTAECETSPAGCPAVVLLVPPGSCSAFTRSGSKYPPLGLCQLAAVADASTVRVLDADGLGLTFQETLQEVARLDPVAVGMTITTYTFDMVNRFVVALKAQGRKVLLGGPQATLDPKGTLEKCVEVDWIFRGEAEMIFKEVVDRLGSGESLQGLDGVCWRKADGDYAISSESPVVPDLDLLPLPRLDGLPMQNYWCPDAHRLPMMTMMTTRGCPHRCGFCSSPELYGRRVRAWSVPKVLDYIEDCVRKFGIKEISFVDDVFTIDKARMRELCQGILDRELDITWFCNSRADQITDELAYIARRAGCHEMYLGFESGDPKIIKTIQKDTTIDRLLAGATHLKRHGIDRSVGFVVGLPGEDEQSADLTIALAKKVNPERLQFTRWSPLVGSPLYNSSTQGGGFHSAVTELSGQSDHIDERVQRMYEECGRGTKAPPAAKKPEAVVSSDGLETRVFHPPPEEFADIFPDVDLTASHFSVVVITAETKHSMATLSRPGQLERDAQVKQLLARGETLRTKLLSLGSAAGSSAEHGGETLFCDIIDPRTGGPVHSTSAGQLLRAADLRYQKHLGFDVVELGCCSTLYHHNFGACMASVVLLCVGSEGAVEKCLSALD